MISKKIMSVGILFMVLCFEAFGGPTPPQSVKADEEYLSSASRDSYLVEVSPLIDNISIKSSATTIEVFIEAWAYTDCYDKKDNVVELRSNHTRIIPRLSRTKFNQPCPLKLKKFNVKVAELDAADPASKEIRVLGFRGWHSRVPEPPISTGAPKPEKP